MGRISKQFIIFFLSFLLVLSLPAITKAETWAWYNETNISYPASNVECGTGGLAPGIDVWFCWLNYTNKVMDHSFMNFSSMDAYYNSSGDSVIIEPGDTYTLSAYQEPDIITTSEPNILNGIILFIQGLFT